MTYKHICANCKWWDITDNTDWHGNLEEHECHRNPSHPHYGSPRVPENHSCGEFAIANPATRKLVSEGVKPPAFDGKSKLVDIGKWGDEK